MGDGWILREEVRVMGDMGTEGNGCDVGDVACDVQTWRDESHVGGGDRGAGRAEGCVGVSVRRSALQC